MINLNTLQSPAARATVPLRQADAGAVERFEAALAAPAESASQDLPEATDAELARLSPGELASLRAQWGADEQGLRRDAKVLLTIQNKVIEDAIMREIKKSQKKVHL